MEQRLTLWPLPLCRQDFEQIEEASPHFLSGYTKEGGLVSYEFNGMTEPSLFAKYKIKPAVRVTPSRYVVSIFFWIGVNHLALDMACGLSSSV